MPLSYSLDLQVRDHELDQYGVVNNAVYANYLEHARHEFLISIGIDPAEVARQGRSLALSRIELRFRAPLRSREGFRVTVSIAGLSGARVTFAQQILRPAGLSPVLEARAEAVFLDGRGRPMRISPEDRERFIPYLTGGED